MNHQLNFVLKIFWKPAEFSGVILVWSINFTTLSALNILQDLFIF